MHHGTCVTQVPWCMSGSLTCADGENVPDIPGACAPAILRIWQEAHWGEYFNVSHVFNSTFIYTVYLNIYGGNVCFRLQEILTTKGQWVWYAGFYHCWCEYKNWSRNSGLVWSTYLKTSLSTEMVVYQTCFTTFFPLAVSNPNTVNQLMSSNNQLTVVQQYFTNIAAIQNVGVDTSKEHFYVVITSLHS